MGVRRRPAASRAAVGPGERSAKRDGDQAGEQPHQQRARQLAPPLLVCTQEVAHFALHQAGGNDGADGVFLPNLFRHADAFIRTRRRSCHARASLPNPTICVRRRRRGLRRLK